MSIEIRSIEKLIGQLEDQKTVRTLEVFETAVNDWPDPVSTLGEYVSQLEQTLGESATKITLERFSKNFDFQKDAWKAESITGLLGLYRYCDERESVREIVAYLEREIPRS